MLALKSASTPLENLSADSHSSQPPKKKRKTAPRTLSDRVDLRTLINDLRSGKYCTLYHVVLDTP